MIHLDDRRGSIELLPNFSKFDVDVESTRLEYADVCWPGYGEDGDCMIGLERKRITDLIKSMRDDRLSGHQLQGLFDQYQYQYLMVEGMFRPGDRGELVELRGRNWVGSGVLYREVDNYLSTIEQKTPMIVRRSSTDIETVAQIVDLYKWWQKPWGAHRSHLRMYCPPPSATASKKAAFISPEEMIKRKYGEDAVVCWKMAAQLPGLDTKAEAVASRFKNAGRMFRASVEQWMEIDGIGRTLAERYERMLR